MLAVVPPMLLQALLARSLSAQDVLFSQRIVSRVSSLALRMGLGLAVAIFLLRCVRGGVWVVLTAEFPAAVKAFSLQGVGRG